MCCFLLAVFAVSGTLSVLRHVCRCHSTLISTVSPQIILLGDRIYNFHGLAELRRPVLIDNATDMFGQTGRQVVLQPCLVWRPENQSSAAPMSLSICARESMQRI